MMKTAVVRNKVQVSSRVYRTCVESVIAHLWIVNQAWDLFEGSVAWFRSYPEGDTQIGPRLVKKQKQKNDQ